MLQLTAIKSSCATLAAFATTATAVFFSGLICTEPVKAATLVPGDSFYTNLDSFRANTNGLQGTSFQGLPVPIGAPTSFQPLTSNTITINGVTFTGTQLSLAISRGGNTFPPRIGGDYLSTVDYSSSSDDKSISAFLPEGITAVGAFLNSFQYTQPSLFSTNFTISLADGSSQIVSGGRVFVGFTSSSSISSITFSIPGGNAYGNFLALPSFAFGYANAATPATAVPEPFTIIGTLIGGTAALRMRKKLKAINN